ncbi:GTP pyrophosphokinase family protein [Irregularibacter muris]|uniref:GTP pyrophosphokinase family protein n=1 Tax=Irregularibacter muris TaxID=1796619 RepID=A0AAE3KYK4_9FIRM|nr:GTP pyrophosphokinase family protein [Irregularibacter muris]MCR1897585.1 GTP pyrophosphokinase family protein [Irregularibacter muris]
METKDWERFLIPYEQAVEELTMKFQSLKKQYVVMGQYSPIELVIGRVKKVSSILEKSKRQKISIEKIENEMEDIAGIRIICQFVEDINKVVQLIRERHGKDLHIVYEKDYVSHEKESGYRSYHVIIRYPVQCFLGEQEVLAEIQIRTLAMNFWATIEHSLNYKYKENIPEKICIRLKNAAEAAFSLDQEMSQIREEIKDAQKTFTIRSSTVSQILHYIQTLYKSGKEELAEKYQDIFAQMWEKGDLKMLMALAADLEHKIES